MDLLLTGGSGFFGKSILDYLNGINSDINITIVSRRGLDESKHYESLHISQILSDVRNLSLNYQYDYIIHAATPASLNIDDAEMKSIIEDGMQNMIQQAKRCNCKRFLFTSSGAVYGNLKTVAVESNECNPTTQYGRSKLVAEQLLANSELDFSIARCFAFSGTNLKQDIHFAIGNFIRAAKKHQSIVLNGTGNDVRSYLDQKDLAKHLMQILLNGKNKDIYNVGSNRETTILQLATLIRDMFSAQSKIVVLGDKNMMNSKSYYVPNVSKIEKELNCIQTISLEQSLREMYNI